jgi:hypothetical protein
VIGPFPLAPVIQRVRDMVPRLKLVGTAADLRSAVGQALPTASLPAAFIVRQERAIRTAGASGGVLIQQMEVDLIVVLYLRNHASEKTGSRAASEMDQLVPDMRAALLNWTPVPDAVPITFNASRDQAYEAGTLIVQELFKTAYRIEVRP